MRNVFTETSKFQTHSHRNTEGHARTPDMFRRAALLIKEHLPDRKNRKQFNISAVVTLMHIHKLASPGGWPLYNWTH